MGTDHQGRRHPHVGALALLAATLLIAASLAPLPAPAGGVDDLFGAKTISLVIAAGESGGFDIAARLAARHFPRFLAGEPAIVPQNMPDMLLPTSNSRD